MPITPNDSAHRGRRLIPLLVVPVLAAIAVTAFTWASASPEPHDVPFGVVGPPAAIEATQDQLAVLDGAYDLHSYDSLGEARDAIEDRDVYGALVHDPSGTQLLTASAASPAVAELLTSTFASPETGGTAPTVTDVVPADADDPRGTALGAMVLPLVLVSMVTAMIVLLVARSALQQIAMIAAASVLGSLTAIAIAQGGFGIAHGDWVLNSIPPALTVAALSGAIVGAVAAFGRLGFVAVAPVMLFLGNPWAGATSSPHLLPEPAGLIGQLLPPGAGASALRSIAFFDGAGAGAPLLVLGVWIALGLIGIVVGALRHRDTASELAESTRPLLAAMDR